LISDFEKFMNDEVISVPHLIRIAILHYQFETIHPFLDGNGRMGRLLITLYLVDKELLAKPSLYLSDFFERNKGYYYDSLTITRQTNNLRQWIDFFLEGVIETSKNSIGVFQEILLLKSKLENELLPKLGLRLEKGSELLRHLYRRPIINANYAQKILNTSLSTASRLVKDMESLGILREYTGYGRNRRYIFDDYLKLFSD